MTERRSTTTVLLGAILWTALAFAIGYLVGAERQFSKMPLFRIGQDIQFDSKNVMFVGWSPPESNFRWSEGKRTAIVFRPEKLDPNHGGNLSMTWTIARSQGEQPVSISLNGKKIADFVARGAPGRFTFPVPRELLKELKDNELEAVHPNPVRGGPNDPRKLAIALVGVHLAYEE